MWITKLFVNRPTLVTVALAAIALGGIFSYATLINQNFPNIDFPTVRVRASYPGGSPSEIRDAIVRPLEDAIAGAPNLDHLTSTIQNGQASISATFVLGSDKTTDLVEVQRRVQSAEGNLPGDLVTPTIGSFDPGEADVATLVVTSRTLTPQALSLIVNNQIVPDLEQVPGIANVDAGGALTPAIEVDVDPARLSASGLTLADVVSAITNNNVRAPGGIVYQPDRETSVDVRGDVTGVKSVANLFLQPTAGGTGGATLGTGLSGTTRTTVAPLQTSGSPVFGASSAFNGWSVAPRYLQVTDVAHVFNGSEVRRVYSYVGPSLAITLDAQKTTGASEVTASKAVLAALPTLRARYPQVRFEVLRVQAEYTAQQIMAVWRTLAQGILLTGIVMLFFLRSWRNAVAVLIAIPSSLFIAFIIMKLANFTVDTVSLLAMTLIIGILVDDSIVVIENIERHYEHGEAPRTSAILGRSEIGPAAIVITLVDVVVFLPIAFLPGITGRFLAEFALVVVAATLTSLAVSFTITPALAGNWALLSRWKPWPVLDSFARGFERTREWYSTRVIDWALARPRLVFGICGATVAFAVVLLAFGAVGFEFFPSVDRGEVFVQVRYPTGSPLSLTNTVVQKISAQIAQLSEVQSVTGTAGSSQQSFGGSLNVGSSGQLHVFLKLNHKQSTEYWAKRFGQIAQGIAPGADVVAIPATGMGGGNAQPIDYLVSSLDDRPELYAGKVLAALQDTPGTLHATSSYQQLTPQVAVVFDRDRARALDVDIATAANAIRSSFGGSLVTQFETPKGIQYVQVTYPQSAQTNPQSALRLPIRARNGSLLTVGDIGTLQQDPVEPIMTRTNRQTVIHISANLEPGYALSNVQRTFRKRLAALGLPNFVSVTPNAGGQQANLAQTMEGMGVALLLSLLLVYLLMLGLYDSYRLPFIIMFAVPVAAVGAIGALALTRLTLNLFSLIGTILLVGLVSKNGILLAEFANNRIRRGIDKVTAIREAAHVRFRPIIMTTASMVAGMFPLALALEPGSGQRQALGVVVIGGLLSSLLLTLVVVPVAFVRFAPKYRPRPEPIPPPLPIPAEAPSP
ncbi:MAG: efflux RND transporter permease subunit [Candidatus Eremiobacteraeota bacterium]|nr:efflux RND transporter permease subunit [Candidatus Eremiobacteraeota bacterium]